MKRRGEYEWSEVPYPVTTVGSTDGMGDADAEHPVARLYLPDPEQYWGWREWYVRKPGARTQPIGFRKPGAR